MEIKNFVEQPKLPEGSYLILIDDDEDDTELLSASLIAAGIKLKTFSSGKEAMGFLTKLLPSRMPSLIILDFNMPVSNGENILRELKANQSTTAIPVVIFSTSISASFRTKMLALGAMDCFIKPFTETQHDSQISTFRNLYYRLCLKLLSPAKARYL